VLQLPPNRPPECSIQIIPTEFCIGQDFFYSGFQCPLHFKPEVIYDFFDLNLCQSAPPSNVLRQSMRQSHDSFRDSTGRSVPHASDCVV
jgi:hypothetical protein